MSDEKNQLRCEQCGYIAYHQFRSTRTRMMHEHQHAKKHKEKTNG